MILALDIETNLAHDRIWCCGIVTDTGIEEVVRGPERLIQLVSQADVVLGHNIIEFDYELLRSLWGVSIPKEKIKDTILMSRLWNPRIQGGHSLKAWGQRFNNYKGDFTDFDAGYSAEMAEYCLQDTRITMELYKYLDSRFKVSDFSEESVELEHQVQWIVAEQVRNGFKLDVDKATELYQMLWARMVSAQDKLQEVFPPIVEKRTHKTTGKPLPDRVTEFNPGSRKQIAERLLSTGVKLTEQTEKGAWKIDETVLEKLNTPESNLLLDYFLCQKRTGQIDQWLSHVTDGRVHGKVYTNGAVTGRMTHCVPLTTKALTRDGWRGYSEIAKGDEVLGFNMESGLKEWTTVTDIHYSEAGVVGSIGTESRRIRCTEDHKVIEVVSPGKSYQKYCLTEASNVRKNSAVLMNAPYNNTNIGGHYKTPLNKYEYNHSADITQMSDSELNSFMTGFLLADGYLKRSANGESVSWSFAQAEGEILDAAMLAMFLYSSTRISLSCKTLLKGDKHRFGYNVTQTQCSWMRSAKRMVWVPESVEPVWCLQTKLGTWTMLQEDGVVTLTGNSNPNMAQVPAASSPYGKECRECWTVDEGNVLVGIDASGLELRMLAHYMDDKDYTAEVVNGDVHTKNQEAAGLPDRDTAKTFIYAFLYGAGAAKIGSIVGGSSKTGTNLKKKFLQNTQALSSLIKRVRADASKGSIKGLDGRKLRIESEHAALNTLLQGAGAIIMKKALVIFKDLLDERNIPAKIVGNIHDEWQVECPECFGNAVGRLGVKAIVQAGEHYRLNCPLDGEYKVGKTWAETH